MVGDRHRLHAQGRDLSCEVGDPYGGIEQGVVGVEVEVCEWGRLGPSTHGAIITRPPPSTVTKLWTHSVLSLAGARSVLAILKPGLN